MATMENPHHYKIPDWFLNRQKDGVEGKYGQVSFIHSMYFMVVGKFPPGRNISKKNVSNFFL